MCNRDKSPYDITVGITLRTGNKIQLKLLENNFKRNKQKHLIISGNLHILMKCSLIDICVIFYFRRRAIFLLQHVIWYSIKNTLESEAATGGVLNFIKMRLQHRYFPVKLAKFLRIPIMNNMCSPVQYGLLVM